MSVREIPLFPLHAVLFPGGPLALKVFEPRYLAMVARSISEESPFGICLIREGREVGTAALPETVGTLVRVTYWNRRSDGVLGITVRGEQRFRTLGTRVQPDQLIVAEVEPLAEPEPLPVPEQHQPLVELLRRIMDQLDHPYITLPKHYDDAAWVSGRLAELLPIDLAARQELLQVEDLQERLQRLSALAAGQRMI